MDLKEPRRRVNAAHVPLSSDSFRPKEGFLGIWERWFRAYWAYFILTGVTALRLQHKTASVGPRVCPSSGVGGLEGKGGEERRPVEAGTAFSPSLPLQKFTQQGIYGPGTQSTEVMNQITLLFLCSQWKEWEGCPKGTLPPLWVSSSRGEPRPCYLLSLNQKLTITSLSSLFLFPACQNFWPALGFKYFALSRLRRKGEGFFPYGFLI